ncbi:MAG: hypothetical protein H7A23_15885 [Leptospiraceae bacterium]|nr:hypothetical protein [Leptospiraceae bacterium]MCP5496029.1 hypothetical protein [Leptospiraceae bacterium]
MTPNPHKLDERNHVEIPLLKQLEGLGWEVIDLTDATQNPTHSLRTSFSEVVLSSVLKEQLQIINPWIEEDQIEDGRKRNQINRILGKHSSQKQIKSRAAKDSLTKRIF